jgi:D-alanyl-D-alanine carboxypeptidase
VVEAVTGTPFEQQLRARLFEPLALGSTSYVPALDTSGTLAHAFIGSATLPGIPLGTLVDVTTLLNGSWFWGAAAIVSNGDDVTKFFAALLRGEGERQARRRRDGERRRDGRVVGRARG